MRHAWFIILVASGCGSESMSADPSSQDPGPPVPTRRLAWTDNGKHYEDDTLGMSRVVLTQPSKVDAIIAMGGSLEASMTFSVANAGALAPGVYTCADANGSSLHYASMSYSLDQPLAKLDECTFTITGVSSTSGAVVAGTFEAKAVFDTAHELSGDFSAPVAIVSQ